MNVLVTGGAGFIGTHLVRRLLREHCKVTVLDSFHPQIHGTHRQLADDISKDVDLRIGDVRDAEVFGRALAGQHVVVHLAAETGTGQSMYEVVRYGDVNVHGTAVLLEHLARHPASSVQKVVLASSRAVYGEGKYACAQHGITFPAPRAKCDIEHGRFEPPCPICREPLTPLPTDEGSLLQPGSFYGVTKQTQEQMVLMYARQFGFSAYALRYQNVYGPGQSLRNPYTGILAIFSTLAQAGSTLPVFEDGRESRDFVHVDDVVRATWEAVRPAATTVDVINIGTGLSTTILHAAQSLAQLFDNRSTVHVTGQYRLGDVRHNRADITKARCVLGYAPRWEFAAGLADLAAWATEQTATSPRRRVLPTPARRTPRSRRTGRVTAGV